LKVSEWKFVNQLRFASPPHWSQPNPLKFQKCHLIYSTYWIKTNHITSWIPRLGHEVASKGIIYIRLKSNHISEFDSTSLCVLSFIKYQTSTFLCNVRLNSPPICHKNFSLKSKMNCDSQPLMRRSKKSVKCKRYNNMLDVRTCFLMFGHLAWSCFKGRMS
jgi:hypothetical protein